MDDTNKKKKKKKKFRGFNILLSILLLITTIYLGYNLYKLNVLPSKYLYPILGLIALIDLILILILNKRFKVGIKVPFAILTILIIAASIYGVKNLDNTTDMIKKVAENATVKEEVFDVYVLNNSKYQKLTDLDGHDVGIYDNKSDLLKMCVKTLNHRVTPNSEKTYDDLDNALNGGINREVEALVISEALIDMLKENYNTEISNFRVIDRITVKKTVEIERSNVNVTEEPFTIYISGLDTRGSIKNVGRSDVNILAVVNPKKHKVLLVHTPRDYYVKLHSKGAYDKLTHAGIYGIDESYKTIEDIYARDVDFYFKTNFSTLMAVVDSLNGVTVNIPQRFCEQDSRRRFGSYEICLSKGVHTLDGEEALAFARHRHTFAGGDMARGNNQEVIIKAIVDKLTSPSIITNYSSITNSVSKYLVTNMTEENMTKLAKYQIKENPTWEIESANVDGTGGFRTTYSGGRYKLSVIIPNDSSITNAKRKIAEYMDEEVESESKSIESR